MLRTAFFHSLLWLSNIPIHYYIYELPQGLSSEDSACQCRRLRFHPWVRKIPWRRQWQLTPVFLPGESHGERSLVGHSPWGLKSQTWLGDLATEQQQARTHAIFICGWSFSLLPCLGYCKQCFTEHWCTYLFELELSLDICPGMGLLTHMASLFLVL